MMPSPPIDDSYDTCHPRWLAAGRCGATKLAAVRRNPVVQRDDHALTPMRSSSVCSKPTAAAASVQPLQAPPRG
jgi:hypothetical protein